MRKGSLYQSLKSDFSGWTLILSNLLAIYFAVRENWSLPTTMLIYWCQSSIIGLFNFVRILSLKQFSTKGLLINERAVQATQKTKISVAFFFLIHYGGFHAGYLVFLLVQASPQPADKKIILLTAATFLANHFFSFLYNFKRDTKKQNLGRMLFFPYARIIPMHLTLVFGGLLAHSTKALVFFLVLKTLTDWMMHLTEHAEQEKKGTPSASPSDRIQAL
jgi:hypothetical protein